MQQLFQAYLISMARQGQADRALDLWIKNHQMLNALLSSRQTVVFSAIVMITQGISDKSIVSMLPYLSPDAAQQKQLEQVLLKPAFGEQGMDLKKIYQADHNFIFGSMDEIVTEHRQKESFFNKISAPFPLFYKRNYTRNQFARCVSDLIAMEEVPDSEFDQAYQSYSQKYKDYDGSWFDLVYNVAGQKILSNCRAYGLFQARHAAAIRKRMIVLLLRARQSDVSKQNMAEFVARTPPDLNNPRTGKPFDWDGQYLSFATPSKTVKIPYLF
jgi:hypothetical protein